MSRCHHAAHRKLLICSILLLSVGFGLFVAIGVSPVFAAERDVIAPKNAKPKRARANGVPARPQSLPASTRSNNKRKVSTRKKRRHPIVNSYCKGIADAAAEARFDWQAKVLMDLQKDLDARVGKLKAETEVIKKWIDRREQFMKKAHESLIQIYSGMRPDAASSQLIAMDIETAAAIILKLDPRIASAILNEMDPKKAAKLSLTISGAGKFKKRDRKS